MQARNQGNLSQLLLDAVSGSPQVRNQLLLQQILRRGLPSTPQVEDIPGADIAAPMPTQAKPEPSFLMSALQDPSMMGLLGGLGRGLVGLSRHEDVSLPEYAQAGLMSGREEAKRQRMEKAQKALADPALLNDPNIFGKIGPLLMQVDPAKGVEYMLKLAELKQKGPGEIETARQKKKAELDLTRADKVRESAQTLRQIHNVIEQINAIHARHQDLTGPIVGRAPAFGINVDPDIGALRPLYGQLQQLTSSLAVKNPSGRSLAWAGSIKPSVNNPQAQNEAMVRSISSQLQDEFGDLSNLYSNLSGEELPFSLADNTSSKESQEILSPDGKSYTDAEWKAAATKLKTTVPALKEMIRQKMLAGGQ